MPPCAVTWIDSRSACGSETSGHRWRSVFTHGPPSCGSLAIDVLQCGEASGPTAEGAEWIQFQPVRQMPFLTAVGLQVALIAFLNRCVFAPDDERRDAFGQIELRTPHGGLPAALGEQAPIRAGVHLD